MIMSRETKTPADRLWEAVKEIDGHEQAASKWGSVRISRVRPNGELLSFVVHCAKQGGLSDVNTVLWMGRVFTKHLQKETRFAKARVLEVPIVTASAQLKKRLKVDETHRYRHAFMACPKEFFQRLGVVK